MASIGRGRGRGWVQPQVQEAALRRPGQTSSPKSGEFEELVDAIYNNVPADEFTHLTNEALVTIANLAYNASNVIGFENLVEKLWEQALEDRCFALKVTKPLSGCSERQLSAQHLELMRNLQRNLFSKIQNCYEAREELCVENFVRLSNLTWCLGTMIKLLPYALPRALSLPLVNCLDRLLDNATEENIETVAFQILLNGKIFTEVAQKTAEDPSKYEPAVGLSVALEAVVNKARTVLVNRNVSARTRASLLLIVDLANRDFEPLTGDLSTFYTSILAENCSTETETKCCNGRELYLNNYLYKVMREVEKSSKQKNKKNTPTTTSEKSSITTTTSKPTTLPKTTATTTEKSLNNKLPIEQTRKMNLGTNEVVLGPVPRAIRGSGASESSKDSKNDKKSSRQKDKLTDQQVWASKTNTSSKVYGHDDRFDNDYD